MCLGTRVAGKLVCSVSVDTLVSMKKLPRGLHLIEVLVTLAILMISTSIAMPSFTAFFDQSRLHSAANHIHSFLASARMESIKRGVPLYLSVDEDSPARWCLGLSLNQGCNCFIGDFEDVNACQLDNAGQVLISKDFRQVELVNKVTPFSGELLVDSVRGTLAADVFFLVNDDKAIGVRVTLLGGLSVCSPSATDLAAGAEVAAGVIGVGGLSPC